MATSTSFAPRAPTLLLMQTTRYDQIFCYPLTALIMERGSKAPEVRGRMIW